MEKAVHHHSVEYLESEILSDQQYGYRKYRLTELASIHLTDDIRKSVDKEKLVGALFMDLSKAFDTLSHDVLTRKFKTYSIRGIAVVYKLSLTVNRTVKSTVLHHLEKVLYMEFPKALFWVRCFFFCTSMTLGTV